ncbi:MAG TPA: hypothetical protein VK670_03740 [Silvibacterium sp.]|nr:hypothetical protein [Silvibacterium sp.]
MALLTNNITEARAAYADLELFADATQQRVVTLQATVDNLTALHSQLFETVRLQNELTLSQISTNAQLTTQQVSTILPDVTLDNFIASLGLSIALAEATMPDRTIGSVSASVQSYLTLTPGPNGAFVPGLRLYQPELGQPSALATTSFDVSKTVALAGTAVPRSLYTVLQEKQSTFADPFWTKFASGTPPAQPAARIVAEVTKIFAAIGSWSFPYLLQEAAVIAGLETTLAGLIGSAAPQNAVGAYTTSVQTLFSLVQAISARSIHVAGDLYALATALDTTTNLAHALIP